MDFQYKDTYDINDLIHIMRILRAPDGCPWDRVQTHESIRQNFIEETYEAVEAIDKGDSPLLKEELGDVLMQVIFHSLMEEASMSRSICTVPSLCQGARLPPLLTACAKASRSSTLFIPVHSGASV